MFLSQIVLFLGTLFLCSILMFDFVLYFLFLHVIDLVSEEIN